MDSRQALASLPTSAELPFSLIAPPQVWSSLTLSQQNCLLQAIVRICREVLMPVPAVQEADHE